MNAKWIKTIDGAIINLSCVKKIACDIDEDWKSGDQTGFFVIVELIEKDKEGKAEEHLVFESPDKQQRDSYFRSLIQWLDVATPHQG